MKEGTRYAARLKRAYAKFRPTVPAPQLPEPDDPLHRLGVAILGVTCGDVKAERAVDRLLAVMVDWNEVRISTAVEVSDAIGNTVPDGLQRARRLIDALQNVFQLENRMSLNRLRKLGRREARDYLERLAGTDEYAVASVLLWSLSGHAIPVDDRLMEALRNADLVHPAASRAEVQAFLERHVSAEDAREFCLVMRSFSSNQAAGARRGKTTGVKNRTGSRVS